MNGVNLDLFQFEYDLTWMSFFMDADHRIYTRYGGRDDSDPESHLNRESLLDAMRLSLALHKMDDAPRRRANPKREPGRTPEQIPTMTTMMAKRKNKCIHCHDVKVATLKHLRNQGRLERDMVFTYPTPANLGLVVDARRQTRIKSVGKDSPATEAGIQPGDLIDQVAGRQVRTFGDVSSILNSLPASGRLNLTVRRDGRETPVTLDLPAGWKRTTDPSWRESLHVVGPNCGLWGRKLNGKERQRLKLSSDKLALKVTFIWGPHTRKAGIRVGDVIVSLDGQTRNMNIKQLHAHPMLHRDWGDTIPVTIRRGNRTLDVRMTFPRTPPN